MALTFVYGNSGNGKSEYMYLKIADMAEHAPYQHYFVVVPEQFTMSTQKSLVEHSSHGVITNVDVVSFERLAYRVFDELGVHRTVMEETGKSLLLRSIVERSEDSLTILRKNLTRMGYIGELKSVISELMQYGISPDDLEEFIDGFDENSSLALKLKDILKIYREFDEYLSGGYVTAERVLDLLTDVAGESSILRDAVLLFDGYTGFTPVQLKLIERLMTIVKDIYVTVTLDVREPIYAPARIEDLFYMSRKMVNALLKAAGEMSFPVADPVRIDAHEKSRFHDNPVLSHLEQNIFRIPTGIYRELCGDAVEIVSVLSPREELRCAAAEISTLVREDNYRYRDFAIVCSELQEYEKYADEIFAKFDIPGFTDKKQPVEYHPLTELIRSLPEIADTDYSIESVFRYLRTGLAGFSQDEVDLLENYCIEKGIRGAKKWNSGFRAPSSGHGRLREDDQRAAEELAVVNSLRKRFADQTKEVIGAFRKSDATVLERTKAVYDLLCSLGVEEALREETKRFEEAGDEINASLNRQIYKIVIDLLDKVVDLLGGEIIPASDYAEILDAGFSSAKVGTIPPGGDCVILGDLERTRLEGIKVLFLLGANDGAIPKKNRRQSILSPHDRELMEEHGMELAPGEREQVFLQRFYLYLTLTKPSDRLCITCSRMDGDGNAIRPSYMVPVLEKMFTNLTAEEIAPRGFLPTVTAKSSVETYLAGLTDTDDSPPAEEWKALHMWYMEHDPWRDTISELFDAHFPVYEKKRLDPALARALYGDVLFSSFTRLEKFGGCAFAHFIEYGLKLAERREFTFESPDMGTLFHEVLQKYGRSVEENGGWGSVEEELSDELLREALGSAVSELYDPSLFETASGAYTLERVYRILRRSIWAITEQIQRGEFLPAGYEVSVGGEIPEGSGAGEAGAAETGSDETGAAEVGSDEAEAVPRAMIIGRVDRMDVCDDGERVSVRVFDYKSSKTELHLQNVYYGRQLQLPVYLDTAMAELREKYPGREIVPAGVFYLHLDDPMLGEEAGDEEDIKSALLEELKPSGLVNSDPAVLRLMDRDLEEKGSSDVVPVSLNSSGQPGGRSKNAIPAESFGDLTRYVGRIMEEAAELMMEGTIEVNPYRLKDRTGCDYCAYRGICGFDLRVPGYSFREEKPLPNDEALELIQEKLREEDE